MISFEYLNDEEDKILSITQWDEETFEASIGIVLQSHEISNLLPGQ